MNYEFKNLSDVDQLDQLSDSTTIMGFENGKPVQFSTDKVGSVKTVNGETPDESGNIELKIVSDWNDLTNKPFDENNIIKTEALPEGYPCEKTVLGDTLTWDGNTEGLVSVGGMLYKVSDAVFTADQLKNITVYLNLEEEPLIIEEAFKLENSEIRAIGEGFGVFVPEDATGVEVMELGGLVFEEPGIYFAKNVDEEGEFYISSLTIPGCNNLTKTEVKTIKKEFLPKHLQFGKSETLGNTLTWDGNTEGLVSLAGMFYKVSDATFTADELRDKVQVITSSGEQFHEIEEFGDSGAIAIAESCLIVPESAVGFNLEGVTIEESGIYFHKESEIFYTKSLTVLGYNDFLRTEIKTIDPEFLPGPIMLVNHGDPYLRYINGNRVSKEALQEMLCSGRAIYVINTEGVYLSALSIDFLNSYGTINTKDSVYYTAEYTLSQPT